ncbi:MAG: CRTAC1 family protein [Planctomycetales bacterium]
MCRKAFYSAGILLFGILICGCGGEADEHLAAPAEIESAYPHLSPGHGRMLSILADISRRAPAEHLYFGQFEHVKLRKRLEQFGPIMSPTDRLRLLCSLGYAELDYEPTPHQAIEHLTQAYELLPQIPGRDTEWSSRVKFYLGVSWLRLGETENCCLLHNSNSCILPIRGGGIHTQQSGSRKAIEYFTEVLNETRDQKNEVYWHYPARWLLNIAYMTLDEYPNGVPEEFRIPPEFFESEVEFPEFENVAPKLNLNTDNHAGSAIVDDFDNDDDLDVLTCSSDPTLPTQYFRNNNDGTFTEQTEDAGLTGLLGGLNMVQADYNNDGNLDVYIVRGAWLGDLGRHPNSLLRNDGHAGFMDVTFETGLGDVHYPCKTAAWADYDNDGDVDLFVANETADNRGGSTVQARCQLFRNDGGRFTDVAIEAGVAVNVFGMSTVWGDFDGDRFPDLYVGAKHDCALFHNNRDGTFTDVAASAGVRPLDSPFASWFWDYDNDGSLDLYTASSSSQLGLLAFHAVSDDTPTESAGYVRRVTDPNTPEEVWLEFELPGFYKGDGRGGFENVAAEKNLNYPTAPMGSNFGDLNGDGFLDFYLATGDFEYWDLRPNVMFLNQQGEKFANVTMGGGFGHLQKGHGVSFVDIDHDGDQDVYVQMGGQLPGDKYNDALFENPGFGHHWITVKLVGSQSNKSAIGARIHVTIIEQGKRRSIYRSVNSGGSFGCNPLRQNIGLGDAEKIESIEIYWPTSDLTQTFQNVPMDRAIQLVEGDEAYTTLPLKSFTLGGRSLAVTPLQN